MSERTTRGGARRRGFTLIEVVAALVIFSVGVLMVVRLSTASTTQMRYAGVSSALALRAAERLDSLEAEPFASLSPGTVADTFVVSGLSYGRVVTVTRLTPLLARLDVSLAPVQGQGPTLTTTSYVSETW